VVDGEKPGVASRDEGKHAGRNDLLFVEKMMYMTSKCGRGYAVGLTSIRGLVSNFHHSATPT